MNKLNKYIKIKSTHHKKDTAPFYQAHSKRREFKLMEHTNALPDCQLNLYDTHNHVCDLNFLSTCSSWRV